MVFESELSKEEALFFKMIAADDSKDEILVSHINALFQDMNKYEFNFNFIMFLYMIFVS